MTWEKGRQLKSFCENSYTYNANGIRTSKTVGDVKHTYTLDGSKILKEVWGDNVLVPLYDTEESVCGIIYNQQAFYFLKNLQGDVISITNASGTTVANYTYDAWGACTISSDTSGCNIATINPFRYRSYYYDDEIGMYYLQSRYYDPVVGRFLNSDKPEIIQLSALGNDDSNINLFAYCLNSPGVYGDYTGNIPQLILAIALLCTLLFIKTFELSITMYLYAAITAHFCDNLDLSPWWNRTGGFMKKRLENSEVIKKRIESYIKSMSGESYSKKEPIYFSPKTTNAADMDLGLSVGHADDFRLTVQKTNKKMWFSSKYKYIVKIEMSDTYDFAKFDAKEKGVLVTLINNVLGYYPLEWGLLKIYNWGIKHEFDYYY